MLLPRRRCRCTSTCPGACANARTAISIRTKQRGALPFADYVDALIADLDQDLPLVWGRTVHTVFFGGGTPSLFPPEAIDAVPATRPARGCASRRTLEITLETNPGTAEHGRFEGYRAAGVNRLQLRHPEFRRRLPAAAGPHPRQRAKPSAR